MQLETKEKLAIIIPTYNEGDCIEETIHRISSMLQSMSLYENYIIIFDSNSADKTIPIVKQLQQEYPRLILLSEPKKTGLGSAYHQAMKYALNELHANVIFEFDADLSHQPKYIPEMVQHLQENDCVIGSRYVKGGSIPSNWPWYRKLLSISSNWIARIILTRKYRDFTSGFRGTKSKALENSLPEKFISNQYAYKLELFWRLHQNKMKIYELPIDFIDREKGKSKLPPHSIRDFVRVITILRLKEMEKYFKMISVGFFGLILQFVAFNIFKLYLSPFYASQLAVTAALIHNYILHGKYTFKTSNSENLSFQLKLKYGFHFLIYSIFMILFQSSTLQLGVTYFGSGPVKENLLLLVIVFITSLLNYFVYSGFIWRT
ncbi:glycosyltransferase [Legionella busanensis]|uniref:Glycosyltransferase n=1 Tax=Legionella busanensis TaxID=190655 RepID=A0A378JKE9_9GAMM|nr:glycosyltransferase family 2 protein [Legionella busanensis]STX50793.1 glycosyltransferase [Legionella busanensis]